MQSLWTSDPCCPALFDLVNSIYFQDGIFDGTLPAYELRTSLVERTEILARLYFENCFPNHNYNTRQKNLYR